MKLKVIALVTGLLALSATPALAGAPEGVPPKGKPVTGVPDYTPDDGNGTPGPKEGLPAQAKAYGRYCKGQSKKRAKGDTEKGTPFSRCVKAMREVANNERTNPRKACANQNLSKKRTKGEEEKGTPFSRCVKKAAQLKREQRRKEREEKAQTATA
jgi:hypothetical protein